VRWRLSLTRTAPDARHGTCLFQHCAGSLRDPLPGDGDEGGAAAEAARRSGGKPAAVLAATEQAREETLR